jgi:hypothetical protein
VYHQTLQVKRSSALLSSFEKLTLVDEEIRLLIQVFGLFGITNHVGVPSQPSPVVNIQEVFDSLVLMQQILSIEGQALIEYDLTLAYYCLHYDEKTFT